MANEPFPALVQAVQAYRGDKYSQARRWQNGYSDCSSFVGKGMKALGLDPGGSTTLTYLASSKWSTISKSSAGAGDIAVNSSHMVLITGNGTAIGQENPRRNVQEGSLSDLMSGTGPYVVRRYKGGNNIEFAGYGTTNAQQAGVLDFPGAITGAFTWITNTVNWLRIGMVVGGAVLIWITFRGMGSQEVAKLLNGPTGKSIKSMGKKVSGNVKPESGTGN
jgi:hypothetical protein